MRKDTQFCLLEVLTPIHIGSGEYYEPMDYFPKEKALHLFDHSSFQSYLKQIGKSDIFSIIAAKAVMTTFCALLMNTLPSVKR